MQKKINVWTPPVSIPHQHRGSCSCEPTIAYIRVSRVGDRQVLISPDIQLDSIQADCRAKKKRVVKIVSDIDKSGRTFRKRSVDKVLADIKAGAAKSVTVWKWSRWGRNLEYSLAYLAKVKEVGGRVDSATEDLDQDTAVGRFSRDMVMRVDQLLSEQIGEGWEAAHAQRREAGLPHSGRKRFGYDYCRATTGVPAAFTINPDEAQILEKLYTEYVGGQSLRSMAKSLNVQGLRTSLGGEWTPQALGQMLDTGFGAGFIRERSPKLLDATKERSVRNKLTTFDIWRRGSHVAIITPDLWEHYKERRLAQADLPARARTAVHPLSALLYCELCSRRMSTKYSGRNRTHQWVCNWMNSYHAGVFVTVSNQIAMKAVRDWVLTHAQSKSTGSPVDQIAQEDFTAIHRSVRTMKQIQADIDTEVRAIDRLVKMLARELISEDQFAINKAEFEENLARLRVELEGIQMTADSGGKPTYAVFGSLDAVWDETAESNPAALNAALRTVVAFVIVSPTEGKRSKLYGDATRRVAVVGRWEASSRTRWLEARQRRFEA